MDLDTEQEASKISYIAGTGGCINNEFFYGATQRDLSELEGNGTLPARSTERGLARIQKQMQEDDRPAGRCLSQAQPVARGRSRPVGAGAAGIRQPKVGA